MAAPSARATLNAVVYVVVQFYNTRTIYSWNLFSMSNCIGPSNNRSCGNASCGDKPRHVKCLNFGQSILELDVADQQLGCLVTLNRALVVDQNVAHIPHTEKKDYVRKWIETHEDGGSSLNDDLSQLSPVLGTSTNKICEGSPILGNSRKRHRKGTRINRHAVVRSVSDTDCQEQSAQYSANCTIQQDDGNKEENQNDQEYLHKIQYTPPCAEVIADGSPVLDTQVYCNKRRRKLCYETEDCASSKRSKLHDNKIINTHTQIDDNYDSLSEKSMEHNVLEDSDSNAKGTVFQIETEESPERLQMRTNIFLSQTPQKLSSKDNLSHNNKANPRIEIDTSEESNEAEYKKSSSTNNSANNSLNDIIEEVNSQDIVNRLSASRASQPSSKSLFISRSQSKLSQLIANDSDETYYSEAEIMQNQSAHLSTKISLVPSLSREVTGSKSTHTPIISTISTPSKVSPDKIMYARLLDSGKKRPKAKKKSMVAKLQSLINSQISNIRIWRYQMNKKHDATSAQFISVLVRDCSKRFSNQFLKGTLIEDRFNLLQSNVEIEEAGSHNVQTPPRKTSCRDLTIILVCDIVGTLKMMSEVVINVHPPWEVLDLVDFTIEAMYISISSEVPNLNSDKDNPRKREKQIVKEFSCPCIEEERELPFCARKPNAEKPDIMQQIFDF